MIGREDLGRAVLERTRIVPMAFLGSIIGPAIFALGWLIVGLIFTAVEGKLEAEVLLMAPVFSFIVLIFALLISGFVAFPVGLVLGLAANRLGGTGPIAATIVGGGTGGLLVAVAAGLEDGFRANALGPLLLFIALGMASGRLAYRLNFGSGRVQD
jgi:hypothetical protein